MKTLIVVDVQNDFVNPDWGHLYVPNSEKVVQQIIDYIKNNVGILYEVIFTLDWHSYTNGKSCVEPSITWPKHCMQYSEGAAIPQNLINVCVDYNIPLKFFIKGNSETDWHTEYGAFEKIGTYGYDNGDFDIIVNNHCNNSNLILTAGDEFVVCGVAGDYCVMNTIKNLLKYDGPCAPMKISVLKNGVASIDDGTTFNNFIKANNLKVVE